MVLRFNPVTYRLDNDCSHPLCSLLRFRFLCGPLLLDWCGTDDRVSCSWGNCTLNDYGSIHARRIEVSPSYSEQQDVDSLACTF